MPPRGESATSDSRGVATRNAILEAAVRLFAEQGVLAVSNRQIGAAAGKGNTSVVGYYFDSKADLVRALVRRFNARVNEAREDRIARLGAKPGLRDWATCLVHPYLELLEAGGPPTWYARFMAQVATDPGLRRIVVEEATSESMLRVLDGLAGCLPELPEPVLRERYRIASHVILQMCAERERALADGQQVHPAGWDEAATGLVDVLVGMWTAAVTPVDESSVTS
ncbi:TetR/AcrR family transcriptional regulator [Amycolatopsis acidicola]|uniref:TetR/AcrR family transcriptional regulator n=1 Tax=Amycolatopsis acidicola TaxID=2596893 RepID=A0A5N0V0B4_9PSEU|nr:TetR/AcrR family transcriptional regulator [Amycolatopsis acidicola]